MIDPKTLQTFLKTEGFYSGNVDGIFGLMSYGSSRAALKAANVNAGQWSNDRTYIGLEQLFLNKVINAGLIVDGLSGQHTNDAIYTYTSTQLHTITNSWPRQADVRARTSIFGKPGTSQGTVTCPYTMYGNYKRRVSDKVFHFQAHTKIVASVTRILQRTLDHYGLAEIRRLNLDIFSGCYNYRPTTGSSTLSMHAWGIALDVDAAHNQMNESNSQAAFSKPIYAPFLDFFEDEGWTNLGRARNYDWMHNQAPRL